MRIRIAFLAALMFLAGTMAVMAYSQSTVESWTNAVILRTDSAILALACRDTREAEICVMDEDGNLKLDFTGRGVISPLRGADPGFPRGSDWEFDDVVVVTNNSRDTVLVGVTVDGDLKWSGIDLAFIADGALLEEGQQVRLGPSETTVIGFRLSIPDDWEPGPEVAGDEAFEFFGQFLVTATPLATAK